MARNRKIAVGAINIAVHPHPTPNIYVELFNDAFNLKKAFRARGDQYLCINSIEPKNPDNMLDGLYGNIGRFTNINLELPWYNITTNKEAEEDELKEISIPEKLKPNYIRFRYMFSPIEHILVFEHYAESTLSPNILKSFLDRLFAQDDIASKYGEIEVSIISDEEKLMEILNLHQLTHLEIILKRPNPDGLGSYDEEILERLNSQHAKKAVISYDAIAGQSLEPDETTKRTAFVAAQNGEVHGKGKNEMGQSIQISTAHHPKIESTYYDPDLISRSDIFMQQASNMLLLIKQIIKRIN